LKGSTERVEGRDVKVHGSVVAVEGEKVSETYRTNGYGSAMDG
jgi:hypothetical protein